MNKLRFCIGTNDGKTIADSHMGDTETFQIYDIFENSTSKLIDSRNNTAKNMDHAKEDKMKAILTLVNDADILVSKRKSPNFANIAAKTNVQPVIIKEELIDAALNILLKKFDYVFDLTQKRKQGIFSREIPVLSED